MSTPTSQEHLPSRHFGQLPKNGRILLVGSGPGHPSLLTVATHLALTQQADVVLSDKLVPDAVLALIPKHVHIRIARKFPGNADGAQIEMMEAAVEAAKKGLTVVRVCSLVIFLCRSPLTLFTSPVETRRSDCIRPPRRRNPLLPFKRIRTDSRPWCIFCSGRSDIRRHSTHPTRCC